MGVHHHHRSSSGVFTGFGCGHGHGRGGCIIYYRSPWLLLFVTCIVLLTIDYYQVVQTPIKANYGGGAAGVMMTTRNKPSRSATAIHDGIASTAAAAAINDSSGSGGCWRKCPRRRGRGRRVNHILWKGNGRAGLNDRSTILKKLGQIAGYLCANIWVEPPSKLLDHKHNGGKHISADLTWNDFYKYTWTTMNDTTNYYYGKKVFQTYPFQFDNTVNSGGGGSLIPRWLHSQNMTTPTEQSTLLSSEWYRGWDDFLMLDDFVEEQIVEDDEPMMTTMMTVPTAQPNDDNNNNNNNHNHYTTSKKFFVWELKGDIWKYPFISGRNLTATERRQVRHNNPEFPKWIPKDDDLGCQYVSISKPYYVDTIAKSVWKAVYKKGTNMIYLHVRRGDTVDECDTSIEKMRSYLDCTFSDTISYGNMTVLLSTDERDQLYVDQLVQMTTKIHPHVRMIHLDPIIERHIDWYGNNGLKNNNFVTYLISDQIRSNRVSIRLQQRRKISCPGCTALKAMPKATWVKQ